MSEAKLPNLYFITEQEFRRLKPWSDRLLDAQGRERMIMVPSTNEGFANPFDIVRQEGVGYVLRHSDMPGVYFGDGAKKVALAYFTGTKIKTELPDYLKPYGWKK